LLAGPRVGDRAFSVELGLAARLAATRVRGTVAEAVEAGLTVGRVAVQASADVGVDVVGAAARFDRQELSPWQLPRRTGPDLPEHQTMISLLLRIRLHIPDDTVPQIPLPGLIPQRMMPVGSAGSEPLDLTQDTAVEVAVDSRLRLCLLTQDVQVLVKLLEPDDEVSAVIDHRSAAFPPRGFRRGAPG